MGMFRRIRSLFRGEAVSRELDEEMDFHLQMREQRNIEEGMKPAEARRRARLRFGNPAVWRERVSEADLLLLPQTVWQDVRFGSRMLKRHLGFTLTAIFALGLGIGVNTAAFTAYKAFFARKLDARDPASMVNLAVVLHSGATNPTFSYPDYEAFRDQVHAFSGVIAVSLPQYPTFTAPGGVEIHTDDGAGWLMGKLGLLPSIGTSEKAMTLAVSENYFSVLGVTALRGRLFEAKDASELEEAPAVVLSENFWQHRFLSDPAILGKTVRLNGAAFTVMGIAPHNFVGTFVAAPAIWLPLPLEPLVNHGSTLLTDREQECCHLHARLAPGSTMREAESEMTVVADHLRAFHNPHSNRAQQLAALVWPGSPFPLPDLAKPRTSAVHAFRFDRGRNGSRRCVRQCGEPAAGAGSDAAKRAEHAFFAGSEPGADRSPVADRKHAAGGSGRSRSLLLQLDAAAGFGSADSRRVSGSVRDVRFSRDAGSFHLCVCDGDIDGDGIPVWAGAGAGKFALSRSIGDQGEPVDISGARAAGTARPHRNPGSGVGGAGDCGESDGAQRDPSGLDGYRL